MVANPNPWMDRELFILSDRDGTFTCDGYVVDTEADNYLIVLLRQNRKLVVWDIATVKSRITVRTLADLPSNDRGVLPEGGSPTRCALATTRPAQSS